MLLLLFASCDTIVEYSFQLKNDSDRARTIRYSVEGKDSTIVVPPHETRQLFYDERVGTGGTDIYQGGMSLFQYITPDSSDTGKTPDYLKRDQWTMDWASSHHVDYRLLIH